MEEFRVIYDVRDKCRCPDCPVNGNHVTKDIEYGTHDTLEGCNRSVNKAYGIEGAENVRTQKRTVTEWEEVW